MPVPFDVQVVTASLVALEPAIIFTAPELEHVATGVPATEVGAAVTVTVLVAVAFAHPPVPVKV